MENLRIKETEITWESTHIKFGSEIKYKNQFYLKTNMNLTHRTMVIV